MPMPKLTTTTRQSESFKNLRALGKTFDSAKERRDLERKGLLSKRTEEYKTLQMEVIRSDTQIRKDRAAAKLLSKTTLPTGFVPFDPKGSGFLDDLRKQILDKWSSISQGPSAVDPDSGNPVDYHSDAFDSALDDKFNSAIGTDNNKKSADSSSPLVPIILLVGGFLLVITVLKR
jgi:hypothetical protein